MGGFMQPQGHVQVIAGMVNDGLDPQAALDRPRVCLEEASPDSAVLLEEGISEAEMTKLRKMGHQVRAISGYERAAFGRGQIITRNVQTGVLCAGSDPRADGQAVAY
jgi:gamma-glutamyltranspeptidase/glutathione hydrolase